MDRAGLRKAACPTAGFRKMGSGNTGWETAPISQADGWWTEENGIIWEQMEHGKRGVYSRRHWSMTRERGSRITGKT